MMVMPGLIFYEHDIAWLQHVTKSCITCKIVNYSILVIFSCGDRSMSNIIAMQLTIDNFVLFKSG